MKTPSTPGRNRQKKTAASSGKPEGKPKHRKHKPRDKDNIQGPINPLRRPNPRSEEKSEATKLPIRSSKPRSEPIRLNRFIANAGVCSRREADTLITSGKIYVNGKVATELGVKVKKSDTVEYNGKKLNAEKLVYLLLNKPKNFVTTVKDPEGRKTVMDLIRSATKERVYPVGRLDKNTTGLLLLTNDGELAKKLTHPSFGVNKLYQVALDHDVKDEDIAKLKAGVVLEDGPIKVDQIARIEQGGKNEVGVALHSGRNRIIRRTFEHLGYKVIKLDRVMFAGLTKRDLPRGKWRHLSSMEIGQLMLLVR